jgi:hypothetical protein
VLKVAWGIECQTIGLVLLNTGASRTEQIITEKVSWIHINYASTFENTQIQNNVYIE